VSSRARRRSFLVGDHDAPNVVGEASFQAPHRFVVGLPGGDLGVVVGAASAAAHAYLGERGDVQGEVELTVAAAGQAVSGTVSAGGLDRGHAGVVGERGGTGESAGLAGAAKQPAGDDRAIPSTWVSRLLCSATVPAMRAVTVLSRWSASRISAMRSRASCLRAASTVPARRTVVSSRDATPAVRSVGAPPGTRSRSSACSWLISVSVG
jgi:hypothetical protein